MSSYETLDLHDKRCNARLAMPTPATLDVRILAARTATVPTTAATREPAGDQHPVLPVVAPQHSPCEATPSANAPARDAAPLTVTPLAGAAAIGGDMGGDDVTLDEIDAAALAVPAAVELPTAADTLATLLDAARDDHRAAPQTDHPILRARCDDIARRIVRDGGQVSVAALAREVGSAPATIKRLLASSTFRRVYDEVSDELMGTIDERIVNERLDTGLRQDSLQRRAMTMLNDCFEIVARHKKQVIDANANPRPGLLKLAIDAAAEVRQIGTAVRGAGATGGGATVNINVTRNQATIIQGAIRESGVDLSDVLDGVYVDAPASASKGA